MKAPLRRGEEGGALLVRLGERVRALRGEHGLTRKELALRGGLSERFLADLESGRGNISVVKLAQLAQALDSTPGALLDGEGPALAARPRVVALLGLRGAGKSTIGPALAQLLGVSFFELDRLVETEAGMRLSEIFAIHGEGYYRRMELLALERFLAAHAEGVLATGGGVVASDEAFELLKKRTRTVWLKATPEEHWARVVRQGDTRPMANRPHAMAELKRRLRERGPLYAQAEVTLSTSGRSVPQLARALAVQLAHG